MEVFLLVIFALLVVFLLLAGVLAGVKVILEKMREKKRRKRVNSGNIKVVELTDEEFAAYSANRIGAAINAKEPEAAAAELETVAAVSEVADGDVVNIALTHEESKSLAEKYEGLEPEMKKLYDTFISYVQSKEDISSKDTKYKTTYRKLGKKVFDITIRRDIPVLSFYQMNTELDNVLKENDAKPIKLSRINKKIKSESDLIVAEKLFDSLCTIIVNNSPKRRAK